VDVDRLPLVLMYHSVEPYETDPYLVTVHPRRFDRQLRWLQKRRLRGVSMAELLTSREPGTVGLTFDDGYTDFATIVLPALQRYGFTATVFVIADALGGYNHWDVPGPRKPLMTAADVRLVADAGMEVGSHSLHHVRLTKVSDLELREEVVVSRARLAEIIGQPVTGFCYPYGAVGAREVQAVRDAGYDYACSVSRSPLDGRHAMPRAFIGDRDGAARLFAKVTRHKLSAPRAVR
jgi:peptidoglycan/xylan/chitin deacetylase (PgdA/CDA1 family)